MHSSSIIRSIALVLLPIGAGLTFAIQDEPPQGPFGLSMLTTVSGIGENYHEFYSNEQCALCHAQQWEEMRGSMHSVAHEDSLYRHFAELAREEAGEEIYTYCSGCHSPAGVISELIPDVAEAQLPDIAKAGVTCDVCHQIYQLTGEEGPWGEPGNASVKLEPGDYRKFGPGEPSVRSSFHKAVARDFYNKSEYCASCHTVIHPINGLRIEHTYDEWKKSVYAEKGIQCQDCHMRSVEDAIEVARTLTPKVKEKGIWAAGGEERFVSRHYFVGGNADAHVLGGGEAHGEMAVARLKSAATLALESLAAKEDGGSFSFEVVVTNVGAGHSLPTSLTELREMWVQLRVTSESGALVFESGHLDEHGEITDGAIRFGAHTIDAKGEVTYKPWEAVGFGWKRLIPPRESARDRIEVPLPAGQSGPLTVEARLLFRTAPPHVLEMVMGEEAYTPRIVEMATATAELAR